MTGLLAGGAGATLLLAACVMGMPTVTKPRMTLSDESIRAEQATASAALTAQVRSYLASHTVVFVGGFLNEIVRHRFLGSYFRQNISALREILPGASCSRIFPPSGRPMEENLAFIESELTAAWERGGRRPMVVIGHSKGGAELLLALLRHPVRVLDGTIERVVLIQSSIGGSPVADCLADPDACRPDSRYMRTVGGWLRRHYLQGLRSLRTTQAGPLLEDAAAGALAELGEERFAALSRRISYVRTVSPPGSVGRRVRAASRLLAEAGFPRNDGMLPLASQHLALVGSDRGDVLAAGHADLVCSGFGISKRNRRYRAAFTRVLFAALAEEDDHTTGSVETGSEHPFTPR